MKKIIYTSECKDAIIYYDTKNNKPLKAIKSKCLETKKQEKVIDKFVSLLAVYS